MDTATVALTIAAYLVMLAGMGVVVFLVERRFYARRFYAHLHRAAPSADRGTRSVDVSYIGTPDQGRESHGGDPAAWQTLANTMARLRQHSREPLSRPPKFHRDGPAFSYSMYRSLRPRQTTMSLSPDEIAALRRIDADLRDLERAVASDDAALIRQILANRNPN
jgi:hypothetical protein